MNRPIVVAVVLLAGACASPKPANLPGPTKEQTALECKRGKRESCNVAGRLFGSDRRAREYFERGCSLGHAESCESAAMNYAVPAKESGLPANPERAQVLRQQACRLGSGVACFELADEHPIERLKYLEKGCEAGFRASCDASAIAQSAPTSSETVAAAVRLLGKRCDGAVAEAKARPGAESMRDSIPIGFDGVSEAASCARLGELYERGEAVRRNAQMAFSFYDKACALRYWACGPLGRAQLRGIGTRPSRDAARQSFKLSCRAGNASACLAFRALDVGQNPDENRDAVLDAVHSFVFAKCPVPAAPAPPSASPLGIEADPSDSAAPALEGSVCAIPVGTQTLRDLRICTPFGSPVHANVLDVAPRRCEEGFPGVAGRTEWFAIDFKGSFSVENQGAYAFRLLADDGALLFVDDKLVIDNDGLKPPTSRCGYVELGPGAHAIRVRYFQGGRTLLALQLFVTPPGESERLWSADL